MNDVARSLDHLRSGRMRADLFLQPIHADELQVRVARSRPSVLHFIDPPLNRFGPVIQRGGIADRTYIEVQILAVNAAEVGLILARFWNHQNNLRLMVRLAKLHACPGRRLVQRAHIAASVKRFIQIPFPFLFSGFAGRFYRSEASAVIRCQAQIQHAVEQPIDRLSLLVHITDIRDNPFLRPISCAVRVVSVIQQAQVLNPASSISRLQEGIRLRLYRLRSGDFYA